MTLSRASRRRDRGIRAIELQADRAVHWIGILAGVVAAGLLLGILLQHHDNRRLLAAAIYVVGLLAMLGCSAAYNLTRPSPLKELLRRFDHAAIFLMIAGTYTPFMMRLEDRTWEMILLAIIWPVAIAGAAMKLAFPRRLEGISVALYLALGWIILVAFRPLIDSVAPTTVALVAIGGVLYSAGVVFHLWESLPFQKAIWHGMVVAAAACHYSAILFGIALAPAL
jgi:hemolysin III